LQAGESVVGISSGGGGYGSPLERDPARVALDVSEGWVSVEQAKDVYGVVCDLDGNIDEPGTSALRAA